MTIILEIPIIRGSYSMTVEVASILGIRIKLSIFIRITVSSNKLTSLTFTPKFNILKINYIIIFIKFYHINLSRLVYVGR